MTADEITRRLKRVEGQIRGLQRMVEEDRDCEAIVTQLMAARAALDRVGLLVVERFIEQCLADAEPALAQQRISRVLDLVFSRYSAPLAGQGVDTLIPTAPIEEE